METPLILPPKYYELDSFRYSIEKNFQDVVRFIGDGEITTDLLADDAVTSAKIADDAVDTAQLADSAVDTDQIADDAVTSAKVSLTTPSATSPTLALSWVDYGTPYKSVGYRKGADGLVVIEGAMKSGTDGTIFTLPVGYRPSDRQLFRTDALTGTMRVIVASSGAVITVGADAAFSSFDGIAFYAA